MTEALTVYTHFNGSLINKYCKNDHRIISYVTPSTDLSNEQGDSAAVVVIDYGLLYSAGFTQNRVSVAEGFKEVLNGYYEYIKSVSLTSDRVLVIGMVTNVTAVSFFDHYLNNGYISQTDSFSERIRSFLNNSHKGIYLSYQSQCARDERNHKMSITLGASHDPILFKLVGSTIDSFSNTLKSSCKAIIFDLDNTLWKGVIGEGFQNSSLGNPKLDDSGYSILRDYVRLAYETGIFTAICSKNDINTLTDELDRSGFSDLLDHFTIVKANWRDKSKNITDIAKELNIGLESCVFIDDNPRELSNIIDKLPQVLVVDAGSGAWNTLDQLIRFQYVKRNLLLEDDICRNKTTTLRIKDTLNERKSFDANNFGHKAEFYECDVSLPAIQMRIEQLSLKTNQFNLSTRRLTWRDIDSLMRTQNFKILVYGGKDKYGDLGTIGYILYKANEKSLLVCDWIMSCRAFGLRLEHQALKKISGVHKVRNIKIQYDKNDRNKVVSPFFENFNEVEIDVVNTEVI
jgi:FkbH-like protein